MAKITQQHLKQLLNEDIYTEVSITDTDSDNDTYRSPSTPHQTLHQLKHGHFTIDETILLRGLTLSQAQSEIKHLLSRTPKQTCYLLVHGKGQRSENNVGKIKQLLHKSFMHNPQINAYCPAQAKDGGEGAMYVLIRGTR